ncbi:MAG TPA: YfdX family protein [Rhodobacteraceae bacterium]|nr:YfdX family protein [Paracoccaceae bacterium]
MLNWKNTILALSLASLAGLPAVAQDQTATEEQAQANAAAEEQARQDADQVLEDAITALDETGKAIAALADGKTDDAVTALETAIGKLEVVLTQNPGMTLAPVDVATTVLDIVATPEEIRRARKEAVRLLDDHQLQLARPIISNLASEIDIATTYIPLGTYPLALKSAAALIKEGDPDAGAAVLANALNTLVVVETVVPLPLLNAQLLIEEARALSENAERSEEENARLEALLDAIDAQIAKGEALEYGGEDAFEPLKEEMEAIRETVADGGSGEGVFDKLSGMFKGLGRDHSDATK